MEMFVKRIIYSLFLTTLSSLAFATGTPSENPTEKFNLRVRQQRLQIERDAKLGKLTKDQAKALKAQLETIRKAELADLKANNSRTLTDAQITELSNQLNTLSKAIPVK